MMRDNIILDV